MLYQGLNRPSDAPSLTRKADSGCLDEILVDRSIAGNHEAFDLLVRRYYGRALATAVRYSKNSSLASDVVSSAFAKAFQAIPRFRGQSRFWTWLHRIVMTTAFDANEAQARADFVSLDDCLAPLPVADRYGHQAANSRQDFEAAIQSSTRDDILGAFRRLPKQEQDLLRLRYGQEMPYETIAQRFGIALGTVKSRLNRARRHLRRRMPAE